ncbi:MAG TPA: asparagine synthase (glutamine-hydrolyzing), partial [Planctomycetaceae bacterium]|nr:asparagine synthase (glutamine-hydrolyzing) [Planctomycetaceae bacterium]
DEDGFFVRDRVGLAMRRLRIIDLAGGTQPIANEDETISIVFNGEIYNYRELRKDLIRLGHRFRTQSDTEVIVHAYEQFGVQCVEHLDGMFAFAIYDERIRGTDRLFLARDPFGKKPLYYADLGETLIFGSEIKPILEDPRVSKEIDFEALHHYLSLLVIPAPWSIFKSIRKLPAGHWMLVDERGPEIRPYWNCEPHSAEVLVSEREAVDEVRRLLFRAVEKRLVADVPLGAFLSGGLDSSLVVAIMARLSGRPVKTLSVGFEGPKTHNELPFARRLAEHCGTDHTELTLKPDVVSMVHDLVRYADEPFGISSALPTLLIARAARERLTVVLTGDGGDEMFGGYSHYLWERWASAFRRLPRVADSVLLTAAGTLGRRIDGRGGALRSRITRFVSNARRPDASRRLGWGSAFSHDEKLALYSDDLTHLAAGTTTALLERYVEGARDLEPAAVQNRLDVALWLPDEMLAKVDRMTMGASIEARCPLLDRNLARFLFGLPFRQKVPGSRGRHLKHLLRRVAADLLPAELLQRPKQGFNVPLDAWFRGGASDFLTDVLSPERIRRRGWFQPEAVQQLVAAHRSGQVKFSNRLYALFNLELWAQEYLP